MDERNIIIARKGNKTEIWEDCPKSIIKSLMKDKAVEEIMDVDTGEILYCGV